MKKRNNLFKKIMCLLFTFCVLLPYVPVYAGDSISVEEAEDADAPDYTVCTYDAQTAMLYLAGSMDEENSINTALGETSRDEVKAVVCCEGTILPTDCLNLFHGFSAVESIDLANADSSAVTCMRLMFNGCKKLKTLDLSHLDTSSVDRSLGYIRMLAGCESLEEVTFGGKFNTAGAQQLTSFFSGCSSLKTVDFTKFSTAGAWDISHMFDGCTSLETLDTTKMSIASVNGRGMVGLFTGCSSLTELDLSNWSTSGISIMANLFSGCSSLKTIYVGEGWRVGQVSESQSMFYGCVSLVGGMGTVFDPNGKVDKTFACIDQGEISPGYLTRKGEVPEKKELTTVAIRCDATIKMDDGSYYRTYSYTGEPVVPKEIWVYEYYSGSYSYKFMEASDYYKLITDNIEPGKGKITVYPSEYGRYSFEPVTLEFPINKAKVYDKDKSVTAPLGRESSVSLNSLLEEGAEAGVLTVSDTNSIFDGTPQISDGVLSFKIVENEELIGKKASINVNVPESAHYKAYNITVTVTVGSQPRIYPQSVSINRTELSLSLNETYQLSAVVLPENAFNREIRWSSGNSNIAKVDETGLVTAVEVGTIKIYAASVYSSSIYAECMVTVKDTGKDPDPGPGPEPDPKPGPSEVPGGDEATDSQPAISAETESLTLVQGQKFNIGKGWSTKDTKVLSVNKKTCAVKAKKTGTATITHEDGAHSIAVTIVKPTVTAKLAMEAGETKEISLSDASGLNVVWCSSAPDVATVEDGKVTAVAKGSAKITAWINGTAYKTTVKVSETTAAAERTLHLNVGKSKNVKIKGLKKTVWTVAEENAAQEIVEIKGSKIKAKKAGEITLTADAYTLKVIVEDPAIVGNPPKSAYKLTLQMSAGETKYVKLTDVSQDVIFKSNKNSVAFISTDETEEGYLITARSKGTAKITAKVNGKTISITVKVK